MGTVIPAAALVRPRVVSRAEDGPRLLEDVVAEMAGDFPPGVVWLVGGPGSGKSTAIAHLASLFADDGRLAFLDEPTQEEIDLHRDTQLVVATASTPTGRSGLVLRLLPWGFDDLVEYLLLAHHQHCGSVMKRLGMSAESTWAPELARLVLDRFAADPALTDPIAAILGELRIQLPKLRDFAIAAEHCLAIVVNDSFFINATHRELARISAPPRALNMLRHSSVRMPLAAERFASELSNLSAPRYLSRRLPREFVELVGQKCRDDDSTKARLRELLDPQCDNALHSMAASILAVADPTWRTSRDPSQPYQLSEAQFPGVDWPEVNLIRADIRKVDFRSANLANAIFDEAMAAAAVFTLANLSGARLIGIRAAHADFRQSRLVGARLSLGGFQHAQFAEADLFGALLVRTDLSSADLSRARLMKADLCRAQLSGAILNETDFTDAKLDEACLAQADLRKAVLEGACFERAVLTHAQLEDVTIAKARFQRARLEYAHLTGSRLPAADLRYAELAFAHLAEIEWPAADLRGADLHGASFHLGSSRSGLVGSPIACEGSKTGYYTDEREEKYFKCPDEIRKANLRGADLRGANIDGVDFYLVDLREAHLHPTQIAQARQTGAILDDWESR